MTRRVPRYIKQAANFLNTQFKKREEQRKQEFKDLEYIDNTIHTLEKKNKDAPSDHILISKDRSFSLYFWMSGAIIGYLAYLTFQSLTIVYMILTGFIISIAVESIISIFEHMRIGRMTAIWVTYLLFMLFLLSGFLFIIPFISDQIWVVIQKLTVVIQALIQQIQLYWAKELLLSRWLSSQTAELLNQYIINQENLSLLQKQLESQGGLIASAGSSYISTVWSQTVWVIGQIVNGFINIILVITISVLCSIEKPHIINLISKRAGSNKQLTTTKITKIYTKLWYRLKTQFLLCIYIGIIVYIGLRILDFIGFVVPDKWSLALISWITEFIPYIGPLLWSVPALLVIGTENGIRWAVASMTMFFIIQWTENNILIPYVMNKALWISPLFIFISMIIGGTVLWFIGIILAIPLAAIITILIDD